MPPLRVAIVSCGIANYPSDSLETNETPLQYTHETADEFAGTVQCLWPEATFSVIDLVDDHATIEALQSSIEELSKEGVFEAFVFFFSGHGRKESLVFYPNDAEHIVDSRTLEKLLSPIRAKQSVYLFDCCYSGSFASQFAARSAPASVIISSSSENDQSWEDAKYQRTCFGQALLSSLKQYSDNDGIGFFTSKFEEVKSQTTISAYGLKNGRRQEPHLWVGENVQQQGLSTFQALKKRTFQITAGIFVAALLVSFVILFSTYRFGVNETGRIVLLYGPSYLSFMNFGPINERQETRFTLGNIRNDTYREQLSRGEVGGVWTQRNVHGQEDWIAKLQPMLTKSLATDVAFSLGREIQDNIMSIAPTNFTNILLLLGEEKLGQGQIKRYLEKVTPVSTLKCGDPIPDDSEQPFGRVNQAQINNFVNFLSLSKKAAENSSWYDHKFVEMLIRREHAAPYPFFRQGEPEGALILGIVDAIAKRRTMRGQSPFSDEFISMINEKIEYGAGCSRWAEIISAGFLGKNVEELMDDYLGAIIADQEAFELWEEREFGDVSVSELDDDPELAPEYDIYASPLFGVQTLLHSGELYESDAWTIREIIDDDSPPSDYEQAILASSGPFPKEFIGQLFSELEWEIEAQNFETEEFGTLLLRLARQTVFLPPDQKQRLAELVRLAEQQGNEFIDRSEIRDKNYARAYFQAQFDFIWGLIALGIEVPNYVVDRIDQPSLDYSNWQTDRGLNREGFAFNRGPHGIRATNLARLSFRNQISPNAIDLLEQYASDLIQNRIRIPEKYADRNMGFRVMFDDAYQQIDTFLLALGRMRYFNIDEESIAVELYDQVSSQIRYERRKLEVRIAAAWISSYRPKDQILILDELRKFWAAEDMASRKLDLADLIVTAAASGNLYLHPNRLAVKD